METTVQNFFTWTSLGTFAGASGAVLILSNTARTLFKWRSVWPAFIFALLISFFGANYATALKTGADFFLAVLNACLLFSSAAGIHETAFTLSQGTPVGGAAEYGRVPVVWWSSWFK